jgi:hypothetical protein
MAQWPPSGLNSFGHPGFEHRVVYEGPRVLKSKYTDGKRTIRVKSSVKRRRVFEHWECNRDDAKLMKDFFEVYGLSETFTMLVHDPRSGDNFATDEMIATFEIPVDPVQIGPKWYTVDLEFYEAEL